MKTKDLMEVYSVCKSTKFGFGTESVGNSIGFGSNIEIPFIKFGRVYYIKKGNSLYQVKFNSLEVDKNRNLKLKGVIWNGSGYESVEIIKEHYLSPRVNVYESIEDYANDNRVKCGTLSAIYVFNYLTRNIFNIEENKLFYKHYYIYRWRWDGTKAVNSTCNMEKLFLEGFSFSLDGDTIGNNKISVKELIDEIMDTTYKSKEMCEKENTINVVEFPDEVEKCGDGVEEELKVKVELSVYQYDILVKMGVILDKI